MLIGGRNDLGRTVKGAKRPDTIHTCMTSQTFLATRLSPVDPAAKLDNLSELAVERLVGLQHSSVIIPGGVLRYISDGDVRSPFLGLKFAI